MRFVLHPEIWTEALYEQLVGVGESWVRSEEGAVGVVSVRADFKSEISVLERMGYREERRARQWELDLVANRESLLAAASRSRAHMASQGVSSRMKPARQTSSIRCVCNSFCSARSNASRSLPNFR